MATKAKTESINSALVALEVEREKSESKHKAAVQKADSALARARASYVACKSYLESQRELAE